LKFGLSLEFSIWSAIFHLISFDLSVNKDWGGVLFHMCKALLHEEQEGPNKYHGVTTQSIK